MLRIPPRFFICLIGTSTRKTFLYTNLIHKSSVQSPLKRRHLDQQHILLLVRQSSLQYQMRPPLHEPQQKRVQNVRPIPHELDVVLRWVNALPVLDGPLEHVAKLGLGAEVVGTDKVDHAPVLHQVVLERVARKHDPPFGPHLLESVGDWSVRVLDPVAFIANDQVGAWVYKGREDFWKEMCPDKMQFSLWREIKKTCNSRNSTEFKVLWLCWTDYLFTTNILYRMNKNCVFRVVSTSR